MSIVSSCCDSEIILEDICSDCGEHCDEYCDECGNSGVVFDHSSREWEDCGCGAEFNKRAAEAFHCELDPRNFPA